jgi:predicted transcriptional regulator
MEDRSKPAEAASSTGLRNDHCTELEHSENIVASEQVGEVMFPVAAKLKWQDQMAFDLGLSATEFRVGFAIGWAINKHRERALISQDSLAVKIGVNVRTIQRSIDNLERRGHLRVHRRNLGTRKSDGRRVCGGHVAHLYEPIVKSGTPAPSLGPAGSTTNATTKDDSPVEKGRHGSRPFPLNPFYYPKRGRLEAWLESHVARNTSDADARLPKSLTGQQPS